MVKWLLKSLVLLLAVGLVLAGLILLGRLAMEQLREHDRYTLPFTDIECPSPPGRSCAEFLDEVQYLANSPGRLHVLDEHLPERLAACFSRHPWVEKVERVQVAPPRQVRVSLVFRRPVLAVPVAGDLRAVDAHGILLPRTAPTAELPVFSGYAGPPAGPAGTRWGDATVEAAARAAHP
jgi:hypothetical protein